MLFSWSLKCRDNNRAVVDIFVPYIFRMLDISQAKMKESHLKSLGLDVDRLESELKRSVRLEERRWHENDAKLRAVEQKVATYDEFK
nr:coiled coil domain containing protein 103 [Hymenolepis microstoma]